MGAWGVEAFENDTAADWAFELEGANDLTLVRREINGVLEVGDDYLDADLACCALAACEVVARLKGNWGRRDVYSEPVDEWVEAYAAGHPEAIDPDLVDEALAAIDRVVQPPSELLELWQEEDATDWLESVADLRRRAGG